LFETLQADRCAQLASPPGQPVETAELGV